MTLDASALTPELRDLLGTVPEAPVTTESVEQSSGGTALSGYLARPEGDSVDPAAAVLVVHDWTGLTDHVKVRAEMLARLGYVAFAGDIYGTDSLPSNGEEAAAQAGKYYGDAELFRERIATNLATLRATPGVDPSRIAIMGYCFGGSAALEAARAGEDVAGAVSFHGSLRTQAPAEPGAVSAPVLVLTGAADPSVPPAAVEAFEKELSDAGAEDWQIVSYSGALHAFAVPGTNAPEHGAAYQERADVRSWEAMKTFFAEVLA